MKAQFSKRHIILFTQVFTILLLSVACQKDDPAPLNTTTNEANVYVNDWILENMNFWYYWNDDIPSNPDKNQDPDVFFNSLLSDEDRFSWIQDNYDELVNSLQGITKEAGYEYVLYRESAGSNNVIAQVMYVKPSSPAEGQGLKRGDIITHINGTQITVSNYQSLIQALKENHTIQFKPLIVDEKKFDTERTASLTTLQYAENPNYLHKTFTVNDKKIGYFVYNFFATGTDDAFDKQTDAIFNEFKSQGVSELVLDLRFNSGGSETSSKNLASLIGKGVGESSVFLKRKYNSEVEAEILNDPELGQEFLTSNFDAKQQNIGNQLSSGKVYILTSSRTASASELVINALKPYMEVFLIGDTTYGKNVGSISLGKQNDPKNKWGMQPIVVKVFNSLDQSDYGNGFVPNVINRDNSLYIYPLGDARENLLSVAIANITGVSTLGRVDSGKDTRQPLGYSMDIKQRSFNLIMDEKLLQF